MALCVFLGFASAGFAAPSFTLNPGTEVLAPGKVHHVEPLPAGFRMFHSSVPDFIQSSTSSDGLTWAAEAGQRISIQAGSPDAGGITSFGMTHRAASGDYRAYYVGISSAGFYSILSATSTDQLNWSKNTGFNIQFNNGSTFVDSVHPFAAGSGIALYYIRDSAGSNNRADYRAYRMTSNDGGNTFGNETILSQTLTAYNLYVSTLTNGDTRLYITSPLGDGTTTQILSLYGADLVRESGVRFSTPTALSSIGVVKSTDNYRWLAFMTMPGVTPTDRIYRTSAGVPFISGISPSGVYKSAGSASFTISGEVFSSTPAVSLTQGTNSIAIAASSTTRVSDLRIDIFVNSLDVPPGNYSLTVTNSDGQSATLVNALNVDVKPGIVALTDNLFRPLKGPNCKIDVTTFAAGDITIKVYTLNGGFVRTVYDGPANAGVLSLFWDGKTDNGNFVASGLYLVHIKGPSINKTEKVVVIK